MSRISDTVNQAVKSASSSRLNSMIGITVAIAATFMALSGIKAKNNSGARSSASSQAIDTWAYFQAKNTRLSIAESTVSQLQAMQGLVNNPDAAKKLAVALSQSEADVVRYQKEKDDLQRQAEALESKRDHLGIFDEEFDLSNAVLSLSIAMCGVAALTQRRWLLNAAFGFIAFGIFWGVLGFLEISIPTGFLTGWLR